MNTPAIQRAVKTFQKKGRPLRSSEAIDFGIHPRTLYAMRDSGILRQLTRGVYALSDTPINNPDIVTIAVRVPKGVVCLISALSFHNITTQIPHAVHIAIPRDSKCHIDYPPVKVYSYAKESYREGIEKHDISGVQVKVYSAEKTVADCFKFRNKIGIDVAVEALRFCKTRKKSTPRQFLRYARICRVENIMMPYLEALI